MHESVDSTAADNIKRQAIFFKNMAAWKISSRAAISPEKQSLLGQHTWSQASEVSAHVRMVRYQAFRKACGGPAREYGRCMYVTSLA